jgi:hypothetical protein
MKRGNKHIPNEKICTGGTFHRITTYTSLTNLSYGCMMSVHDHGLINNHYSTRLFSHAMVAGLVAPFNPWFSSCCHAYLSLSCARTHVQCSSTGILLLVMCLLCEQDEQVGGEKILWSRLRLGLKGFRLINDMYIQRQLAHIHHDQHMRTAWSHTNCLMFCQHL